MGRLARRFGYLPLLVAALAACGRPADDRTVPVPPPSPAAVAAASAAATRPRIVALGDSLTAGLGLAVSDAYPAVLQQRFDAAGLPFQLVNEGVSGDTSAGGLSRIEWALDGDVRVLIIALGANDGLRGLPVGQLRDNLARMIERAQAAGIPVLLAGMEAPPNYGPEYAAAFRAVYPELAREYSVAFLPFLLDGVAGSARLNQPDGMHPTPEGARIVADHVWSVLRPLVDKASR